MFGRTRRRMKPGSMSYGRSVRPEMLVGAGFKCGGGTTGGRLSAAATERAGESGGTVAAVAGEMGNGIEATLNMNANARRSAVDDRSIGLSFLLPSSQSPRAEKAATSGRRRRPGR